MHKWVKVLITWISTLISLWLGLALGRTGDIFFLCLWGVIVLAGSAYKLLIWTPGQPSQSRGLHIKALALFPARWRHFLLDESR
jgi:hypothetical protein